MPWESRAPIVRQRYVEAQRKGLLAAAYVGRNAVVKALRGGYTSGDFVTGHSVNAVTIGEPVWNGSGWEVAVGTNLLYNLFWELGHMNIFLRHYVRVEKWRPAALDSRLEAIEAFSRVFARVMESGV